MTADPSRYARPTPPDLPLGTARWWWWIAVLAGGVVAYVVVLYALVTTQNVNLFPALLLIGSATVPVSVLVLAEGGREPVVSGWAAVFTAIVGGVVGIVAASLLEYDALRQLGGLSMLGVGLIEEAAKLIVPVILFLIWRPRDPRGGIVIGVASGMGFAVLETMGYGFQALLKDGNLSAVDATLLLRGILSPACHIAWTGLAAAMLWRIGSGRRHAVLGFGLTYLGAVILHALWDGSANLITHIVIAVLGFALLITFIHRAHPRRQLTAPGADSPWSGR